MDSMTTQYAQKVDISEIEIIDGPHATRLGRPETVGMNRRTRWAAAALTVAISIAALAVAAVFAVSALILGAILLSVGLLVRLAAAISGQTDRTAGSR